jgi:hypothetical protein
MEVKYALPDRRWSEILRVSIPPQGAGEKAKPYWERVTRLLKAEHPEMRDTIASIVVPPGYFGDGADRALSPADAATVAAIYEDLLPTNEIARADKKERGHGDNRQ